ncbi:MAG: HAD-IA family hydrolase [Planctomycetota bacterium]
MNSFDWIVFDSTGTLMVPDPEAAQVYASSSPKQSDQEDLAAVRMRLKAAMSRHFLEGNESSATDPAHERERWKRIVQDTLDLDGDVLEQVFQVLWDHFAAAEHWRLYDDVPPTIERLRAKGYRIAIASNFDERLLRILRGMQIESWFDQVLISADLGWSKPNTKFYDVATERIGAPDRSRVLMIGDTLGGDVHAARESGWEARHLIRDQEGALAELVSDL